MRIQTSLFASKSNNGGLLGKVNAQWNLWFSEITNVTERQHYVACHSFPAKPTKKQIRKLRRQFRKENQNSLAEFFAEEGTAAMYW